MNVLFFCLDIRQESGRHALALDAITKYIGLGSYASWDEDTKLTWLQSELNSRRPLFRIRDIETVGFDPLTVETLKTFETLSTLGPGSLGAYVISMSKRYLAL
jgi:phosphoenolpyruvate carboxylase